MWVNGSDPLQQKNLNEYIPQGGVYPGFTLMDSAVKQARFNSDRDELRYSLRSLVQYMPWFRQLYIVTHGQVPQWLDVRHPRVTGEQGSSSSSSSSSRSIRELTVQSFQPKRWASRVDALMVSS
jgi:hypothetical protein